MISEDSTRIPLDVPSLASVVYKVLEQK